VPFLYWPHPNVGFFFFASSIRLFGHFECKKITGVRFLDMLLHKAIGGGATEPACFWKIFEVIVNPCAVRQ